MEVRVRRKALDRERKRKSKAKDATLRGNRDWQHAQVRPPKRKGSHERQR